MNIGNVLYVWNVHYDILSTSCVDKMYICNKDINTFSICGIDKLSISGMEKSSFVCIAYGHVSIHNTD